MKYLAFIVVLATSVKYCSSQQKNTTDSIGYLYEYDMLYYGSDFKVDMNYQYILEQLIILLEKNPNYHLHIRGHVCCGPGVKLSKKRARKAYQFLKKAGIDKNRLSYKGYSNTVPKVFPEKTEEDEQLNRRVDFIIYYLDE